MQAAEASDRIARFPFHDPAAALGAGLALINGDHAEALLPLARRLAETHPASAQAHQLLGLAARTAGDSLTAHAAFTAAARLAPGDALIAHSHARTALEAGLPATDLFAGAARLAPNDGSILTGHAAIDHAIATGATLNKYADPTEPAREGLTVDEAREIASEDPLLIWIAA